jgi:hypothetical protein
MTATRSETPLSGLVCSSFAKVDQAVGALTGQLDRYQAAARKVRNRAMFELPGILEGRGAQ